MAHPHDTAILAKATPNKHFVKQRSGIVILLQQKKCRFGKHKMVVHKNFNTLLKFHYLMADTILTVKQDKTIEKSLSVIC